MREARNRLQDAIDQRDAAQEARDTLRAQQPADHDSDLRRIRLREAAGAVLQAEFQPRADAMVTEITTTLDRLIEQAELVRRLTDVGLFKSARNSMWHVVDSVGAVCRLPDASLIPDSDQHRAAGAARFKAMFEALQADPDAPLP